MTYLYEDELEGDAITSSHLIFSRRLTSLPVEGTNQVSDDEVGEVKRRFRYLARMRNLFFKEMAKGFLDEFEGG